MAKILIIGCGDVGGRLAVALAAAGHEVHGLRRSVVALPGVRPLQGDVTLPSSLQFPADLDYVFVLLAPGAGGEQSYRAVYYEGTRNVLAALGGQRPRRLFWISSSSVYAQDDGSQVDEASPATGVSAAARVLLDSEALARESGWPATIVRFSGLYGPGRLRLLRWVESGRPVQADPVSWSNRIHSEDGAGLLAFLMERDLAGDSLDALYLGTDSEPSPQHEVLDWIAGQLGLPPLAKEHRPGAGSNKRLSNALVLALGYCFRFPHYRAGYADVIASAE